MKASIIHYFLYTAVICFGHQQDLLARSDNDFLSADTIPLPTNIVHGQLQNGFSYYICNTKGLEKKIDIYLVVAAGNSNENSDQMQSAHLIEHLAFNGTKHFPNPHSYFISKGIRRGAGLNGSTTNDRTRYYIKGISSSNDSLITDALRYMRDIAQNDEINHNAIVREKGVIISEWEKPFADRYANEESMKRIIGLPGFHYYNSEQIIKEVGLVNPQAVLQFYQNWYKPQYEAIIVVGDIDAKLMKDKVLKIFSELTPGEPGTRPKKIFQEFKWKNQELVITDPRFKDIQIQIYFKYAYRKLLNISDFNYLVKTEILNKLLFTRLKEAGENGDSLIYDLRGNFNRELSVYRSPKFSAFQFSYKIKQASTLKESVLKGLTELERIRRHGFTVNEFIRAKNAVLEDHIALSESTVRNDIAYKIFGHFVSGESFFSPQNEEKVFKNLVEQLKLEDINSLSDSLLAENNNRDIILLLPAQDSTLFLTDSILSIWVQNVTNVTTTPYVEKTSLFKAIPVKELMSENEVNELKLDKKAVVRNYKASGITEILLSNGAKVLLKPLKGNAVYLKAGRLGGLSNYFGEDRQLAALSSKTMSFSGLGNLDLNEFKEFKKRKRIIFSTKVGRFVEEMSGRVPKENFEYLLQCVYLYFGFSQISDSVSKMIRSDITFGVDDGHSKSVLEKEIESVWDSLGISTTLINQSPITSQGISKAIAMFGEIFSSPSDFTFVISGNFDLDSCIASVRKYIGNIPANVKTHQTKLQNTIVGKASFLKEAYDSTNASSTSEVYIEYFGETSLDIEWLIGIDFLSTAVKMILERRLRLIEGAAYTVGVDANALLPGHYRLSIRFQCNSNISYQQLRNVVSELQSLKRETIDDATFKQLIAVFNNSYKNKMKREDFWTDYLIKCEAYNPNLNEAGSLEKKINLLTPNNLREFAIKYLKDDQQFSLLVLPLKNK